MFSDLSIRTKIALLMTVLLAVVSLIVYLYFPARLHQQLVDATAQKSAALTRMTAFSVADAMAEGNRSAAAAALTAIRSNPDLVYLVLLDARGAVFASFNELYAREEGFATVAMKPVTMTQHSLQAGQVVRSAAPDVVGGADDDGTIYQAMAPVRHRGRIVGRLYTGTSLASANADAARSRAAIALMTAIAFALMTAAVFALSTRHRPRAAYVRSE